MFGIGSNIAPFISLYGFNFIYFVLREPDGAESIDTESEADNNQQSKHAGDYPTDFPARTPFIVNTLGVGALSAVVSCGNGA
jgi:hypothetical protein